MCTKIDKSSIEILTKKNSILKMNIQKIILDKKDSYKTNIKKIVHELKQIGTCLEDQGVQMEAKPMKPAPNPSKTFLLKLNLSKDRLKSVLVLRPPTAAKSAYISNMLKNHQFFFMSQNQQSQQHQQSLGISLLDTSILNEISMNKISDEDEKLPSINDLVRRTRVNPSIDTKSSKNEAETKKAQLKPDLSIMFNETGPNLIDTNNKPNQFQNVNNYSPKFPQSVSSFNEPKISNKQQLYPPQSNLINTNFQTSPNYQNLRFANQAQQPQQISPMHMIQNANQQTINNISPNFNNSNNGNYGSNSNNNNNTNKGPVYHFPQLPQQQFQANTIQQSAQASNIYPQYQQPQQQQQQQQQVLMSQHSVETPKQASNQSLITQSHSQIININQSQGLIQQQGQIANEFNQVGPKKLNNNNNGFSLNESSLNTNSNSTQHLNINNTSINNNNHNTNNGSNGNSHNIQQQQQQQTQIANTPQQQQQQQQQQQTTPKSKRTNKGDLKLPLTHLIDCITLFHACTLFISELHAYICFFSN